MRTLRVPPRHRESFVLLARLTGEQFDTLLAGLGQSDGGLWLSPSDLAARLRTATPDVADETATQFVEALLSVAAGRAVHDDTLEEFVRGIADSSDLELEESGRETLRTRLSALLSAPVVEVTAKTTDVASEHERIFHAARIMTDIRPVFGDDPKRAPSGAVVYHLLKLDMFTAGGVEDVYVALTSDDLVSLKRTVDRALDKNSSLNSYLDSVGFMRFEMREL